MKRKKTSFTKMPVVDQEIAHKLIGTTQKNIGPVDAGEIAALATAARRMLEGEGVKDITPGRIIAIQRVVMSDKGADPTMAANQIRERLEREKRRKK